jgi:diguanylate cyclase (GGDEF)-like protein
LISDSPIRAGWANSLLLLIGGFGALLALMIALMVASLEGLQRHQSELDQVVSEHMNKAGLAFTMQKFARERSLSLMRLTVLDDPFERDEEWMRFNGHAARFAEARLQLLDLTLTEQELELLEDQGSLTRVAVPLQLKIIALIEQESYDDAARLLANQAIPAQNAVIAKVDQFDRLQREAAMQARADASTQVARSRNLVLVLGSGAVALGALIAMMVIRVVRERGARDAYLATHDSLTGLPNRALLMDRLEQAIRRSERNQTQLGLLFIDVDRFKSINDTFGHAAGDHVLRVLTHRVQGLLRKSDTLARLSGDEFVVLLEPVEDQAAVLGTAERVVTACRQPVILKDQIIPASVSVGVAVYPAHGRDADELLSHGDSAMYVSKEQGRDRCEVYNTVANPS